MLSINFLPWRQFAKRKRLIHLSFLIFGVIAVVTILFIFIYFSFNHNLRLQKKRNDSLSAHNKKLIMEVKKYNQEKKRQLNDLNNLKLLGDESKNDVTKQESDGSLFIHIKYAEAENIEKLLKKKGFLSKFGVVIADKRTNGLFVKDAVNNLLAIKKFISHFDVSVPQVLIEARIVNIDSHYEKELGVRFGVSGGKHLSGTLAGANKLAGGVSPSDVPVAERLNVDLPALSSNAAHIGLALFKLAKGTLLDLELSALESEGHADIISKPHLITSDKQPAMIEAGEEIPYQESVEKGVTATSFKKAVLKLQVTPQITPTGKIILHLEVSQDKRGSAEVKGVPTIDTRHISTQVLMNDGQTVVLGGIYEQTKTDGIDRVPFLGDLPVVGVLFRHKKEINNKRESLIFVTPKIMN